MIYLVSYTIYKRDKVLQTSEKQLDLDHPEFAIDGLCEIGLDALTNGKLKDPIDDVTFVINSVIEI